MRRREVCLLIGIVSALATWIAWAAFDPLPLVEDETSYVLQSRIFASGHWAAPTPPAPDFFQQPHVLTIPAVASKYPPGHALVMSVGSLLGAPALMPLLLTGLTGALLFALAARVANEKVALLAWLAWLGDPINLRFRAAYYSEVTSSAMWFLAWWSLLEWRETRRRGWLLALAAAVGWGAITRPLTMLAFAVPIGIVVVRDTARLKLWRDFAGAVALGTLIVAILPLWSARTTGNWRLTPQGLYTHDYLPFDKPGLGVDQTLPARPLSPPNEYTYRDFYGEHAKHMAANLPRIALERLGAIARQEWSGPRIILAPFVLLGLTAMSAEVAFALACSIALFIGYMWYGHWMEWTLYYFEATPILSVLAALGIWRAVEWLRARATTDVVASRGRRMAPLVLATILLATLAAYQLSDARRKRQSLALWNVAFRQMVDKVPFPSAVVFIHYSTKPGAHRSVVANSPDLGAERFWIVSSLGARDRELMRFAGNRVPLAFYEDTEVIEVDRSLAGAR